MLSKARHKQNVTSPKYDVHVQFFQHILLQYRRSKTVSTENNMAEMVIFLIIGETGFSYSKFRFFFKRINKYKSETELYEKRLS